MSTVFEGLIQNIPAIFYRCNYDKSWTTLFINHAIEHLTGYPPSDFIANKVRTFSSIIHPEDTLKVETLIRSALKKNAPWEIEYRLVTKTKVVKWVSETGVGIFSSTQQLKYLDGFILDITVRKEIELALRASEQKIRDMAFIDPVTGLANRNLFTDRLDQLMLQTKRYHVEFSLLFIDLDKFKQVNDTHGHLIGDQLLSMAAQRISSTFRKSDVVARFGGDEFLVITKNINDVTKITPTLKKLLAKLATPYYINNLKLNVTASIGVASYPKDGSKSHDLIRNADKAMYSAKLMGKNGYRIYSQTPAGENN